MGANDLLVRVAQICEGKVPEYPSCSLSLHHCFVKEPNDGVEMSRI